MTLLSSLQSGRLAAEALMADTCRIDRKTGSTMNETTGVESPVYTPIATTACKMQSAQLAATDADAGGQVATLTRSVLHIPVDVSGVQVDDVAVYLAAGAGSDPGLVGRRFRVVGPQAKSFATAKRLTVEEVTS